MTAMTSTSFELADLPLPSRAATWAGRVISGLAIVFLGWDASMKLIQHPMVAESSVSLGWSGPALFAVGAIAAILVALYALPRTSVLGAVLWTGYLGGAVATHLRVGNPLLSHTLFPLYVAALVWGGLWLRDARLRAFVAATLRSGR